MSPSQSGYPGETDYCYYCNCCRLLAKQQQRRGVSVPLNGAFHTKHRRQLAIFISVIQRLNTMIKPRGGQCHHQPVYGHCHGESGARELACRLSERRCQTRSVVSVKLMLNRPAAEQPRSFAPQIRHGDGIPPLRVVCSCTRKHSRRERGGGSDVSHWCIVAVIALMLFAQYHVEI